VKVIVITGSTRGIGFGLADSFLELGCWVIVSGRTQGSVDVALSELGNKHNPDHLVGYPCDVTDPKQIQSLWDEAISRYGRVDIWINNAGIGHYQMDFWQHSVEEVETSVKTNVLGFMYGSRVALKGMMDQGFGALYNMEGKGSSGRKQEGLTLYGTTKAAVGYLGAGLAQEVVGTSIIVGALRPGMVMTELVTDQFKERPDEWERVKPIFNIVADKVETVTPWLARKILENEKNGSLISWTTSLKLTARFLMAPFRKRNVVDE